MFSSRLDQRLKDIFPKQSPSKDKIDHTLKKLREIDEKNNNHDLYDLATFLLMENDECFEKIQKIIQAIIDEYNRFTDSLDELSKRKFSNDASLQTFKRILIQIQKNRDEFFEALKIKKNPKLRVMYLIGIFEHIVNYYDAYLKQKEALNEMYRKIQEAYKANIKELQNEGDRLARYLDRHQDLIDSGLIQEIEAKTTETIRPSLSSNIVSRNAYVALATSSVGTKTRILKAGFTLKDLKELNQKFANKIAEAKKPAPAAEITTAHGALPVISDEMLSAKQKNPVERSFLESFWEWTKSAVLLVTDFVGITSKNSDDTDHADAFSVFPDQDRKKPEILPKELKPQMEETSQRVVLQKPAPQKPAPRKASSDKPAVPKPTSHKVSSDKPAVPKPTSHKVSSDKPAVPKPTSRKVSSDKRAAPKPKSHEVTSDKPVLHKPRSHKPRSHKTTHKAPITQSTLFPSQPQSNDVASATPPNPQIVKSSENLEVKKLKDELKGLKKLCKEYMIELPGMLMLEKIKKALDKKNPIFEGKSKTDLEQTLRMTREPLGGQLKLVFMPRYTANDAKRSVMKLFQGPDPVYLIDHLEAIYKSVAESCERHRYNQSALQGLRRHIENYKRRELLSSQKTYSPK